MQSPQPQSKLMAKRTTRRKAKQPETFSDALANMPLIRVLHTLWVMLTPRQKAWLCFLVGVLLVSGVLEMGTILLIFGFVKGLAVGEDGHREGRLLGIVES